MSRIIAAQASPSPRVAGKSCEPRGTVLAWSLSCHFRLDLRGSGAYRGRSQVSMTLEERTAILEQTQAAILRSKRLAPTALRVRARATDVYRQAVRLCREAFVLPIRGASHAGVNGETIAVKLASGILPRTAAQKTWYGHGDGKICIACDHAIGRPDIEVEADFDGTATVTLRFHSECFDAW